MSEAELKITKGETTKEKPPWHGDVAGNATDGLLLMGGSLLMFCVLSGKWWIFRSVMFFAVLGTALFFWSLYLECARIPRHNS